MKQTKKLQLTIPDYLSIEAYQRIAALGKVTPLEKMMYTISILTGIDVEEVVKWDMQSLSKISKDLEAMLDSSSEFYPIFEYEGTLYGYSLTSKMSGAEFIDLENLTKDPDINLDEIFALLYRPIKKHSLGGIKFNIKNALKVMKNDTEDVFKYYTLEDYNSEERMVRAQVFKQLPIQYALGAMGFFLAVGIDYLADTQAYSKEVKPQMNEVVANLLENIGVGSQPSTHYLRLGSLTLPVINQSSSVTSYSYSTT